MNARKFARLGVPQGEAMRLAGTAVRDARAFGIPKRDIPQLITAVVENPTDYLQGELFGDLAAAIVAHEEAQPTFKPRKEPAPFQIWGEDLDENSVNQMKNAAQLPVSVRGALMPDAHLGYGLPIGGVLAVRNAVIPYAVGVDIACRMKLSVLDMPLYTLRGEQKRLANAIEYETRFGIGANFRKGERRDHPVLEEDWRVTAVTARLYDKAWQQLGTSGSGNHFVEFGVLTVLNDELGLPTGEYLALLSHSGSRGAGATVADHYSKLAMDLHPELPKELRHLAWLDLDSDAGREYWAAMQLMGKYAAANHACIHHHVVKALGAKVLLDMENHHNFAWKEQHDGETVIVHRKGATPAGEGVLGVIPGSMGAPGFVVRGKGNEAALNSAAHGAGRRMSRKQAIKSFTWSDVKKYLRERDVTLLSAGLDEVPMAYKDIHEVMAAQADLVEKMAWFDPRLVKMAPAGERPED
ncbi:MAG: RNA-splicing ligase RtcB [Anaerolineaceae bacterium]|nr:RNA-splicing ligase RtcB [Anaerolineaceae bacterium]